MYQVGYTKLFFKAGQVDIKHWKNRIVFTGADWNMIQIFSILFTGWKIGGLQTTNTEGDHMLPKAV